MICPKCTSQNLETAKYCVACGTILTQTPQTVIPVTTQPALTNNPTPKKHFNFVWIIIGLIVLISLTAGLFYWLNVAQKKSITSNNYLPIISPSPLPSAINNPSNHLETMLPSAVGDFFYTDEVVNPQTNDKYFIKKTRMDVCDINGSQVCDLVDRTKDGTENILANLFFASKSQDLNAKHGASLVAFTTPDILLISFTGGEGPMYYTVEEFDLRTKQIGKTILTIKTNVGANGEIKDLTDMLKVNYYEIITDLGTLYFVNNVNTKFSSSGVYFESAGNLSKVDFSLNPPYDFVPNIKEMYNYQLTHKLNLTINGKLYAFDFKSQTLAIQ